MLEFLSKFFRREEASKNLAKERLRLVLMSDRVSLAPDIFDTMKVEMLDVVRRYLDVDERALDMHFENSDPQFMLLANIPVLKVKARKKPALWAEPAGEGARGPRTNGFMQTSAPAQLRPGDDAPAGAADSTADASQPPQGPSEAAAAAQTSAAPVKRRRRRRRKTASAGAAGNQAGPSADSSPRASQSAVTGGPQNAGDLPL